MSFRFCFFVSFCFFQTDVLYLNQKKPPSWSFLTICYGLYFTLFDEHPNPIIKNKLRNMGTMEYHIKWFLPYWFCVLFSNSCRLSLHMESGNRWWSSRNSKTQMNCSIFNPYSRSRFCRASHFSKMVALNLDVRINLEWVKILSTFL